MPPHLPIGNFFYWNPDHHLRTINISQTNVLLISFFKFKYLLQEVTMNPNEMIFKLPQFEIKDLSEKDWRKVSEKDFITRKCVYRIQNV